MAIDVGTTSVVVYLVDLNTGKIRATASDDNRQIETRDDVIARIVFSLKGDGLRLLQKLIVDTLNDLIYQAAKKAGINSRHIYCAFVAGNSTMIHLFIGVSPRYIREEPYVPAANLFPETTARDLGLRSAPNAVVHCLRGVASYVGADITAGLLASGLNIFTDPQKPMQVEEKIYDIGDPDENSPVLVSTNFSLTYFIVSGEIEASKAPTWLMLMDSEGQSVLTAW
ncbi:acetyl-CoA decarbonylase/synthase, CODH/ACS complex subunit gamma, partial [Candidatus Hakubella thermalkaliphila]